ncbi:SCO2322 family protein [Arsenicicoccus sp. oral taxon 190]|uniref:SCO2322 family protein n=1 Tax=Arsenicicoccus sp. oral taxon 190 TaxID=1658671 RepID=UPI0012E192E3|nr:SCO2322 family protein [Arsenicicoccus sp. oral taxon 190]
MSRSSLRTGVLAALLGLLLPLLGTLPAHAADAYRYWGYYHLSGSTWSFATTGPAATTPADGTVEGFRYAVSDMSTPRNPRAIMTFAQVCGSTPAAAGRKRVGVVVDFGRGADAARPETQVPAPYATCVTVDPAATAVQVLGAAAQPRVEKSMVCGIDGYPASGCSDVVKDMTAAARAADEPATIAVRDRSASASGSATGGSSAPSSSSGTSSSSTTTYVVSGVVVLAALAAAAFAMSRRRRADER